MAKQEGSSLMYIKKKEDLKEREMHYTLMYRPTPVPLKKESKVTGHPYVKDQAAATWEKDALLEEK